jgi:hypothetical protein
MNAEGYVESERGCRGAGRCSGGPILGVQSLGHLKSPYQNPGRVAWNLDSGARSPGSVRGSKCHGMRGLERPLSELP